MLQKIGIWYFEIGWIIMMILGFFIGIISAKYWGVKGIVLSTIVLLLIGFTMMYFKYCC